MKASVVDSFINPAHYASLTDEEFSARFLIPMLNSLRDWSGSEWIAGSQLHLRISIREMSANELAGMREESYE
jgi:hypothetical protein